MTLQCCTNPDAYPRALYRWHKNETDISILQKLTENCSTLEVLANKNDNMVLYKCSAIKYAYIDEFFQIDLDRIFKSKLQVIFYVIFLMEYFFNLFFRYNK